MATKISLNNRKATVDKTWEITRVGISSRQVLICKLGKRFLACEEGLDHETFYVSGRRWTSLKNALAGLLKTLYIINCMGSVSVHPQYQQIVAEVEAEILGEADLDKLASLLSKY